MAGTKKSAVKKKPTRPAAKVAKAVKVAKAATAVKTGKPVGSAKLATRPKAKLALAKPAASALTPARRVALLDLAARLGGGEVAAEVVLAADEPAAYAKKFRARLAENSIAATDPSLPWFALIEGLRARKKLAYLDWKHGAIDALSWIHGLADAAGKAALAPALADATLPGRRTDETLELAGGMLGTAKYALLQLDRHSSSFDVVVAPAADARRLVALARTAGERITHFTGAKLAALQKRGTV